MNRKQRLKQAIDEVKAASKARNGDRVPDAVRNLHKADPEAAEALTSHLISQGIDSEWRQMNSGK